MTKDLIETVYGLGYRLRVTPKKSSSGKVSQEEVRRVGVRSPSVPFNKGDKRQAQAKVLVVVQQMWGNFKESLWSQIALFEQVKAQLYNRKPKC